MPNKHRPARRLATLTAEAALVTSLCSAGCSASGNALFMKFTPDSRWLMAEDHRYPFSYFLRMGEQSPRRVAGRIACISADGTKVIVLPDRFAGDIPTPRLMPVRLVTLGDSLQVSKLAVLRISTHDAVVLMDFVDDGRAIAARVYEGRDEWPKAPPARTAVLPLGGCDWEWRRAATRLPPASEERRYVPAGIRVGIDATFGEFDQGRYWSADVWSSELSEHNSSVTSSDGAYIARIPEPNRGWTHSTLQDRRTGRTTTVIGKDDGLRDFFEVIRFLLVYPFVAPRC